MEFNLVLDIRDRALVIINPFLADGHNLLIFIAVTIAMFQTALNHCDIFFDFFDGKLSVSYTWGCSVHTESTKANT